MLTLILGRGKSGKTTALLEEIRSCPAMGMARRIVIVPEQLSHETERRLAEVCGDEISYTAEVLSFTRLINRVSSLYGGGAVKSLDQGGRILTARLALSDIRSQLKVFASASGRGEFLSGMVSIIDELKSYSVSARQLAETAEKTTGMFSEKLRELSLILGTYDAVTAQGSLDPRDKLNILASRLEEEDYCLGRTFFVDGFTDFSGQEYRILSALLRKGDGVYVTVPCDDPYEGDPVFAPGRETARRLMELARSLGQETAIRTVNYQRPLPGALTYLEKNLFAYGASAYEKSAPEIVTVEACDRLEECRACAAALKQRAMEGLRYRDMMVCAGDPEAYRTVLELTCGELGVPLYTAQKDPVLSHPAVAFVLLALEAAVEGMETETVTAYLKTGYAGTGRDDCDEIENYAVVWAIRGQKWLKPWTRHPEGYDGKMSPQTGQQLEALNRKKDAALAPVAHLEQAMKAALSVREQGEALYRFLEETELYQQLLGEVEADTAAGRLEQAQQTAQIWSVLLTCLQQMVEVLGQTQQKREDFLQLLKLSLEQYQVGTIPAALDSVSFGSVSDVRGKEPAFLYVLGAHEGSIPASAAVGSLLSERERERLKNDFQITLAPDSEGNMERNLYGVYCAFTAPTAGLTVSCCAAEAGETVQPSFLMRRLGQMFPDRGDPGDPETGYTPDLAAEAYLMSIGDPERAALREAIGRAAEENSDLREAIARGQGFSEPRIQQVSEALAQALFGSPVKLSASNLDELGNCPLSFFLRYGLKAKAREEATFNAAEFGTFIHDILEHSLREIRESGLSYPITPEQGQEMVEKYMESYAREHLHPEEQTPRDDYLYQRNGEEAKLLLSEISRELSVSEFVPSAFELQFGGALDPLTVQGKLGQGNLRGFVDRADLWKAEDGDYLRIVDYKTGKKTFDYTDLYHGVGMQMLLYLFTLERSGIPGVTESPIPAGVLYFPARCAISSANEPTEEMPAPLKRSGLVLGEEKVLAAMDGEENGQYLPKNQTGRGFGDFFVSREQMDLLRDFVQKRMGQAVDRILSGDFAPEPYYRGRSHDPCAWCDYQEVCQKETSFRKKFYQEQVKPEEFWEKVGGEENG